MKKYVFTVKEDICTQNGKDAEATGLLETMTHYGTVEPYDGVMAKATAEQQATIDSLKQQIDTIKDYDLTDDEKQMVVTYRQLKEIAVSKERTIANGYRDQLIKVKEEASNRYSQIMALLPKE